MRNASAGLIALLNSSTQVYTADLLTIVQANGTTTRLTNAAVPLTAVSQVDATSHVFAVGPPFIRGATKTVIGVQVDTLALTLMPDPVLHTLGALPWPAAVVAGALDEARVTLERAFMPVWADVSAGTLIQFSGIVGQATPQRDTIVLELRSDLTLLSQPFPRNIYQPGCGHTLYDAGCGLSRAAFEITGTARVGSTARSVVTGLSQPDGYFDLGVLTFTAGPNAGVAHTVKSYAAGIAVLVVAFPAAPVVGNAFSIVPGCDKSAATCSSKFSNLARFRGYPFIPAPENAR